jgi:hypothetical protein
MNEHALSASAPPPTVFHQPKKRPLELSFGKRYDTGAK